MRLDQLLEGIYFGDIDSTFREMEIFSVCCHSCRVMMGSLFVALSGLKHHGDDFIAEAIDKGAFVIVTESETQQLKKLFPRTCFLRVDDVRNFMHRAALKFYDNPSQKVKCVGVTGTNGKTTTTYLIESIINARQKECGVIGTVDYRLGEQKVPAAQTTPGFIDNQRFLTGLAWQHIPYCIFEVSSHALIQDRVYGIQFMVGVFTNLTSDHLDYHKTREHYFSAKAKLFTMLVPDSVAVINTDDLYGRQLLTMIRSKTMTFGIERQADIKARDIVSDIAGSRFIVDTPVGQIEMHTGLIGQYNVYNILAAMGVGIALGIDLITIQQGVGRMGVVPGRLERVKCKQNFAVFIDYAHTMDALENVLHAIRNVSKGRIILVFGCGGDRDVFKRPLMGRIASQLADKVIVTSDNPRSEDPAGIVDQIISGIHKDNYVVMIDRREAIHYALDSALPGDTVLIAGKGHETYQLFKDGKVKFNEREIISQHLSR